MDKVSSIDKINKYTIIYTYMMRIYQNYENLKVNAPYNRYIRHFFVCIII